MKRSRRSSARKAQTHWTKQHRRVARWAYRAAEFAQGAFMLAFLFIVVFGGAIMAGKQ